jgi:hypothetical protein
VPGFLKILFKVLRSLYVGLGLLFYIIIMSILASLVPQGLEQDYYLQRYPELLAGLLIYTGFTGFFSSLLYLIPAVLFFINMMLCSIHRVFRRIKSRLPLRIGPDLIHAGILVILAGGSISHLTRNEEFRWFEAGDSIELVGGYELLFDDIRYLEWEDGRPRDWITTVRVAKDDRIVKEWNIEVNKPLRVGLIRVYQGSSRSVELVFLKDETATVYEVEPGYGFMFEQSDIVFSGTERVEAAPGGDEAVIVAGFEQILEDGSVTKIVAARGDQVGQFIVEKVKNERASGLQFVSDIGIIPVWTGIVLLFLGLLITFGQKQFDEVRTKNIRFNEVQGG